MPRGLGYQSRRVAISLGRRREGEVLPLRKDAGTNVCRAGLIERVCFNQTDDNDAIAARRASASCADNVCVTDVESSGAGQSTKIWFVELPTAGVTKLSQRARIIRTEVTRGETRRRDRRSRCSAGPSRRRG